MYPLRQGVLDAGAFTIPADRRDLQVGDFFCAAMPAPISPPADSNNSAAPATMAILTGTGNSIATATQQMTTARAATQAAIAPNIFLSTELP